MDDNIGQDVHHLLGQVERGLPALGEEGTKLGEKCSSEIGANLRERLLSFKHQALSPHICW